MLVIDRDTMLIPRLRVRKIYTGGDDCIVRVWDAHAGSDQEPKAMAEANESITAMDTSASVATVDRRGTLVTLHSYSAMNGSPEEKTRLFEATLKIRTRWRHR